MAGTVTPEKIKSVLSSFLLQSENSPSVLETFSKLRNDQGGEVSLDENMTSPKSSTVTLRSHKSFLKRLGTFSTRTWFGKPSELSPLKCARYGWENVDTDMLQCAGCKTFLSGKLPDMSDAEAYKHSLDKLKKAIVSSHDRLCVLGSFPCPEDFCQVQVDDTASLSASFSQRVSGLSEVQDRLPSLSLDYLERLGYDEGQAGAYCKRHLMPDKDISPQAVTMAVTGWARCSTNKDILICSMCLRKIGLWNFQVGDNAPEKDSDSEGENRNTDGEPQQKKRRMPKTEHKTMLDPVEEHHNWCPWIQQHHPRPAKSSSLPLTAPPSPAGTRQQTDPTPLPVFLAALKTIAPGLMDNNTGLAVGMKKSPMTEGLRCFRRAIDTWASPRTKSPESSLPARGPTRSSPITS